MQIKTDSGTITVNKKSRFAKWLQGRIDAGAWTGAATIKDAWKQAQNALELRGASAYVVGFTQGMRDNPNFRGRY